MPYELLEATLMEICHCLPSQLDREDAGRLLTDLGAMALYRAFLALQKGQATAAEREMVGEVLRMSPTPTLPRA
jgi:hypothetical protein